MLTKAGCEARQQNLWSRVPDGTDWLLIADPRHVQYLANFMVQPLSFSFGERALLLLERDNGSTLLADNFTLKSAACEHRADREEAFAWYDHKHSVINRDQALLNAVDEVAGRLAGKIGIVEGEWTPTLVAHALGVGAEPPQADLGSILRELRRSKLPDEVELLKACMRAGEAGHRAAREFIKPGVTELDVYQAVANAAQKEAGRTTVIYGDFRASTAENPKAGGLPTDYVLQDGDLFILDYSVMLCGYRSDFTNTYAVGTPSAEQQSVFDHCVRAMAAAEQVLKAGAKCSAVYDAASVEIDEYGQGPLVHHAGHGLGLGHPEPPIEVPESDDELVAGDVVTLEPGLYVEGVGGVRIEHNYLITDAGYERLSNHEIKLV